MVFNVRPIESEFVALIGIVGKVAGVNTVGDYENLYVVKQAVERGLVITLYLIIGFLQFHATAFQLNLNKRQAIDEYGDIVTAFSPTLDCDLVRHLKFVLTPFLCVQKFKPNTLAVVKVKSKEIAELLGLLKTCLRPNESLRARTPYRSIRFC